ncbi:hypothetical protein ACQV5M_18975, partial [Leptospira sp. SA-E8]|uniref:hypothetical protein n=1 Tax=Leptospira sp. SA-E8 TaxID=3422259 RepID=UPI003EC00545
MKSTNILTLILLFLSVNAFAAEDICPFPAGVQASIGASKQAIAAKNSGVSKEDLLKKIPQGIEVSRLLTEIVQEVYDFPTLRPEVYAAYRFNLCLVATKYPEQVSEIKFSDAHALLQKCESISEEGARPPCAMRVVHTISGIPLNMSDSTSPQSSGNR